MARELRFQNAGAANIRHASNGSTLRFASHTLLVWLVMPQSPMAQVLDKRNYSAAEKGLRVRPFL